LGAENKELLEANESLESRLKSVAETRDTYARMVENYRSGQMKKSTLKSSRSLSPINESQKRITFACQSLPLQEEGVPDGVIFKSPTVTNFVN